MTTTTGAAHAAPVRLDYPLSGTTHLKGTDSDLTLGPGTLKATADLAAGTLSADTELPPAKGEFHMIGIVPVSVTTEFVEPEPTKGTIDNKTGAVASTTKLTLRLKNLKVAGIPTPIGNSCQTEVPAVLALTSEPGFNPLTGGTLSGEYTIPKFEHCLLATPLINLIIPGDGNSVSLKLGPAQRPPA
ncbi:hypothetical protein HFV08_29075 [Streptomyces sp. LD120]|uniref:Lipoprotein n=2 Tax=Streptomyces physcomitrii TaxID=2724184 RepID=A0ABX1H9Z1_9ACTN|nr:hypothetical protein [Streptomyces physcomitrii]